MYEPFVKNTTLSVPQPFWEQIEKLAKVQNCTTHQVLLDALESYLSELMPRPSLTPDEAKTMLLRRVYKDRARRQLIMEKIIAEGKIDYLPKSIS